MYSLDEDNDGAADPWELHDWIVWVEKLVYRHVLNEQWETLNGGGINNQSAKTLGWGEYQVSRRPFDTVGCCSRGFFLAVILLICPT